MVARKFVIIGVVVACAVIGAIVAIVVTQTSTSSSDDSTSSGSGSSTGASDIAGSTASSFLDPISSSSGSSSSVTSDPTKAKYVVSALAIGDWGTTVSKDSCCSDSSTYTDFDVIAEDVVADLMDQQAGSMDPKPKLIIGHGDNFYWDGIMGDSDQETRFEKTFEDKFSGDNIISIPWANVMGNHDYGGSSYICFDDGDTAKCDSSDAMLTALKKKFSYQSEYKSPNDDRWKLDDHYYVSTISSGDVTIEVYNIETGDATTHGALETCCQCYGYSEGDDDQCENISRGDDLCCGGDTDMFDTCFDQFTSWAKDAREQLASDVAKSNATWKIVNSHYSPYNHYAESGMTTWFKVLKEAGVQLWMNGHTHGEKHDYSSSLKTHFVENGAGGGIIKSAASGIPAYAESYVENMWTYDGSEYGFFSVSASKDWLKLQYHTADDSWQFASQIDSATKGGVATKHCWYIPKDGAEGKECSGSGSS